MRAQIDLAIKKDVVTVYKEEARPLKLQPA